MVICQGLIQCDFMSSVLTLHNADKGGLLFPFLESSLVLLHELSLLLDCANANTGSNVQNHSATLSGLEIENR